MHLLVMSHILLLKLEDHELSLDNTKASTVNMVPLTIPRRSAPYPLDWLFPVAAINRADISLDAYGLGIRLHGMFW